MANLEHLAILKRGVDEWNAWRRSVILQPMPSTDPAAPFVAVGPDLSGADLQKAKLQGISFSQTNLSGAHLEEADLENATLALATLNDAHLKGASLKRAIGLRLYGVGADLSHAYLGQSWFPNAQLTNANLSTSNLEHAVLRSADLKNANVSGANLQGADIALASFESANLEGSYLNTAIALGANFNDANLQGASLYATQLMGAKFVQAKLRSAALTLANLSSCDLTSADLQGAKLDGANLCQANLTRTNVSGCYAYGISVWDANLTATIQEDIVLWPPPSSSPASARIAVGDISTAQLIYMVQYNGELRRILAGLQSNMILLLGRFNPIGLALLYAVRDGLSQMGFLPQLFQFEPIPGQTRMETIAAMAHLARFVIADVTDAKSVPAELERISHQLSRLPIQLLLDESDHLFGMSDDLQMSDSIYLSRYSSAEQLVASLPEMVARLDQKRQELADRLARVRQRPG